MRLVSGFGLALVLTLPILAQTPPPQPAQPVVVTPFPASLYQMTDVSKSLTLTRDQINRLNAATDQVQARYRDNYAKLNSIAVVDRDARLRELNQQYATDWNKAAADVMNDTQRARYQQLSYQYSGFDSLYYPDVQTRLNLTQAQIKDLGTQWDWNRQQLQAINQLGATDPARATQMYRDYWTQRQDRLNRYLTPEQVKTWQGMTGNPYTFQPAFAPRR